MESTLLPYVESKGLISKLPDGKYEPTKKGTINQYIIKENDILISIRGIVGKLALVNKEVGKVIASSKLLF